MDIRVCVMFSFQRVLLRGMLYVFFAGFRWVPEHLLCDLGLDLGDELNERETNKQTTNMRMNTSQSQRCAPFLEPTSLFLHIRTCCRRFECVCVCMCVCVFITLHITVQPGPVKLIFQCYSVYVCVVISFSRLGING